MDDSGKIEFAVENHSSLQSLAEMEIWRPPQGPIPHLIPLDIELRFDKQVIRSPSGDFSVSLSRAELQLILEGFSVVRGSRFGDEINEPYVLADVTQSVRTGLETEADSGFEFDVTLSQGIFGKLVGFLRRRRKTKKTVNVDNIAKTAVRLYRVIARNKNRWSVVEPKAPYILKGRYLGERVSTSEGEKSAPLCLLTAVSLPAKARIFLRANTAEFVLTEVSQGKPLTLTKNKKAVIGQVVRLSLSSVDKSTLGLQESPEKESILLCLSELRCNNA